MSFLEKKKSSRHSIHTHDSKHINTVRTMVEFENDYQKYELITIIGRGYNDAAVIYLAKHIPTGQQIAIRQTYLESSKIDLSVLQNEIVLCRQLHHESLLPLYTSFVHNNDIWTVMPLMAYGSCRDLIHAYFMSGLPEQAIAYILRDVLLALDYLHNRGIIHRAVKASHILIEASGQVCLAGMRNAYQMSRNGVRQKMAFDYPHTSKLLQWLSPEILEQNLAGYNTKSDIYSVGITACELANGYAPFSDMPATQMLLEKLNGTKPVLADSSTIAALSAEQNITDSGVPGNSGSDEVETNNPEKSGALGYAYNRTFLNTFHQFVDICLEKDPESRPNSASALNHPFFKHLRRKTTEALPSLLHPVNPLSDVHVSNLPKEDTIVDDLGREFEDLDMAVDWNF
ncbi:hypothetical protein ACJMK2_021460 [Sinanodonta woodiana]|uniref:Protein kinase domain-containing protein n=1 Tax=Sinanodonta woodiana TaxID=1069815 RepID=A0ABD3THW0_SINWO